MPDDGKRLEVKDLDASGTWFGSPDEKGADATGSAASADKSAKASEPLAFSVSSPALVLGLEAETLAPATLDVKFGDLPVKVTAKGEKLFGDYVIDGALAIERTSARKLMQSFGIEPPVTSDPKALSAFALKTSYRLTTKQAQLSALDLTLDDTHVRGTAGIEDLDAMALRFDLDVDAINVDRYMAPEDEEARGCHGQEGRRRGGRGTSHRSAARSHPRTSNARGQLRVGPCHAVEHAVQRHPPAAGGEGQPRPPRPDAGTDSSAAHTTATSCSMRAPPKRVLTVNEHVEGHRHRRAHEGRLRHRPRRGPGQCQCRAHRHGQYGRGDLQVPRRARSTSTSRMAPSTAWTSGTRSGARWRSSSARASRSGPQVRRRRLSRRCQAARCSTTARCATMTSLRT